MICDTSSEIFSPWQATEETCPVDYCRQVMSTAMEASCGNCVLCREGSRQVHQIILDISEGNGASEDFELLQDLLNQIKDHGSCEMSRTAAATCLEMMQTYEDEWDRHIRRKLCKTMVCRGTYTVHIDPVLCDGCGKCLDACKARAIKGGEGLIHVINNSQCDKTLACVRICPKGAVKKAASVKPKTPDQPVPVGSFGQKAAEGEGGKRRRRRR